MNYLQKAIRVTTDMAAARFSDAVCVLCSGSVARGEATATSDIDVVVLFDRLEGAYRQSFFFGGWPIEVFAHDEATLAYFFEVVDAPTGVPSLARMVRDGVHCRGEAAIASRIKERAAASLRRGPAPLTKDEVDARRYQLSDMVEDLKAARSRAEAIAVAAMLHNALGDFLLRAEGRWSGAGKHLIRALADARPDQVDAFSGSFDAFFGDGDHAKVVAFASDALAPYGGLLFDGYERRAPAAWRS